MTLILFLLTFTISTFAQTSSAQPPQKQLQPVRLNDYDCKFIALAPQLFLHVNITNERKEIIYDVEVTYNIEVLEHTGDRVGRNGKFYVEAVDKASTQSSKHKVYSEHILQHPRDFKVLECSASVTGYYAPTYKTKTRQVKKKTGEQIRVSADCTSDYAKLQKLDGLERREFAERLLRSKCIWFEPVYETRPQTYKEEAYTWITVK
jgi:hypothetical protein